MSKRDGSGRRLLSQDERVLWTMVTRSIAPLREDAPADDVQGVAAAPQPRRPQKQAPQVTPKRSRSPALTPLTRRMRRSVARGAQDIDARLDLHGLTQSEAHAALLHFLRSAGARGARLVLVITGKGGRGDGERGVLKRQVPQWLALPEFRAFVIGFEGAHVVHGGDGALYVRIRRQRN